MQAVLADEVSNAHAVDAHIQHKRVVRQTARDLDPVHTNAYHVLQAKTGGKDAVAAAVTGVGVAGSVVVLGSTVGRNEHGQGEAHLLDPHLNKRARVRGRSSGAPCEALPRYLPQVLPPSLPSAGSVRISPLASPPLPASRFGRARG